ncbi:toll/interleukin-1 receptor domain-containing protein [Leptolyngbya sp. GGD]|uniref:toll/interleukin-1 receptor domain-containing protein n=1 Tax=Leptolyngbya sp. GGD TaxID=2997907 RepID=UPI00227A2DD1|nr:toll/interleukin-1 receptor domain-containing protein [Leptolyngbya sp. GGD]MCY6489882.1 toll/interleukin-1 receptor domain-containing protein [Leptolyngbya sp. GGD]
MSDAPKFDLRGANIGNLAETVQGNQIAHMQSSAKSTPDVSPSPKTESLTLFYSYAHADETLRDELDKHLKLLQRQGIITAWHDRDITAGTEWATAIDQNLNTADIILLLISANFLASDYCYETELTRALDRHTKGEARIIPIILKPCDWESAPFGKLQALPIAHGAGAKAVTTWNNQDEAFLAIAQGIRKAAEEIWQKKTSS